MEKKKSEAVLCELNRAMQETSAREETREELPAESIDDFSTAPIGFEEMTAGIREKVEILFERITRYNRHSAKFLNCCGFLETGIKYLAGASVTKAVLEKKGHRFPLLKDLSTHRLYGMTSFTFRKLDAALSEQMRSSDDFSADLLKMEYRYFHLLDRLKAAETRIYDCIGTSSGDSYSIVKRALMFTDKAYNSWLVKKYVEPPVFRQAPSFPVLKEAVLEYETKATDEAASEDPAPNQRDLCDDPAEDKEISSDTSSAEEKNDGSPAESESIPYVSSDLIEKMAAYYHGLPKAFFDPAGGSEIAGIGEIVQERSGSPPE